MCHWTAASGWTVAPPGIDAHSPLKSLAERQEQDTKKRRKAGDRVYPCNLAVIDEAK